MVTLIDFISTKFTQVSDEWGGGGAASVPKPSSAFCLNDIAIHPSFLQ